MFKKNKVYEKPCIASRIDLVGHVVQAIDIPQVILGTKHSERRYDDVMRTSSSDDSSVKRLPIDNRISPNVLHEETLSMRLWKILVFRNIRSTVVIKIYTEKMCYWEIGQPPRELRASNGAM
jgi:hypothetical protein